MKTITLTIVLFLSFTLVGNAQKRKAPSADKALSILLADYSKTSDLKLVNTKKFIMNLSKKKHNVKGLKIKKVKLLTYITNKKEKRSIYLIQKVDGIAINGPLSNFNTSIFGKKNEAQNDDEPECDIVTAVCDVPGNCTYICVISNSCDESSGDSNCCDGASCDEEDGINTDLTSPLEVLMG